MCKNLVEKGQLNSPLLIYNRSTKRATDLSNSLQAGKTEVVNSLEAAVSRADLIFTCVANDDAIQEVYEVILRGNTQGKLLIDCSTVHPGSTEVIAGLVIVRDAQFVAAPVFGPPAAADAGQLIGVLAGPRGSVNRAKLWFRRVTARAIIDLSDKPYSKALELKVLGNTFIFNMVEHLAQAHVVAEKSGLGTQTLHEFVELFFPAAYSAYSTRMLTGDYHTRDEPLMAVNLARKDADHAKSIADAAGAQMKTLELADAHLAMVNQHCGEQGDLTGIYGAARKEVGLQFEN